VAVLDPLGLRQLRPDVQGGYALMERTESTGRCRYCGLELDPEDVALGYTDRHRYCEQAESAYAEWREAEDSAQESDPNA
jgi:hypothetical protein